MGYLFILHGWKNYIFHTGISWYYQSILGHGLIPEGKEKDKARQAVFLTPTNPFGNDPEEEERHMVLVGNTTKMQYIGCDDVRYDTWRMH